MEVVAAAGGRRTCHVEEVECYSDILEADEGETKKGSA